MIKRYLAAGCLFLLTHFNIFSQDLALQAPFGSFSSPVTGCALTSTETVSVTIVCFGSNLPAGTTFNVTYTINGGAPVTEAVMLGSTLLASSTYIHTFVTPANLSVAGTYDFDANVTLTSVADINTTNDNHTNHMVTNNAASAGGSATGGTNVCFNANSGNVTLVGQTGSVLNWEQSVDGGFVWTNLSNTTTSQSYNNLTVATQYRAVVQNATCPSATSTATAFTIDATSVGGTITGATNVCVTSNSGTLTSTGKTGIVLDWEFATAGAGGPYSTLGHAGNTHAFVNLPVTTYFRVLVQNNSCSTVYSAVKTVTVNPASVGGSISTSDTVCRSGNGATLTLSGQTGSIVWQSSPDGITFTNVVPTNTTVSLAYLNLINTTYYRTRITSGVCALTFSDTAIITVDAVTIPGSATSNATLCAGANSGTLNLAGNNGNILNWESSIDGGASWSPIANTTSSENYLNVLGATLYRVQVKNGVCAAAYSDTVTLSVDSVSLGGTLSSPTTVCSGVNSGTLTLASERGNILNWESSTTGTFPGTNIPNTTSSNNYTNLSTTTHYRVQVQNGVCGSTFSDTLIVTVDSVTVAGAVTVSATVCEGSNSDTLNLGGQIGSVVQWQFSNDGVTWLPIVNTTTSQSYLNLSTTTLFRTLVQSGVCPASTSTPATITVDPIAVGGNIIGSATVCASANSGNLTAVGFNNTIVDWEQSTDGGTSFTSLGNSTATQSYLTLGTSTIYRVIVASGVCADDTSSTATITVDQPSVGGTVTLDDTVCAGANGDTLDLAGQTGAVVQWELSTDNGTTWLTLSNTTASQIYNNLLTTSLFRARIQNGVCPAANSVAATITVNPQSDGGVVNSNQAGCEGQNSGVFTLTGAVGTIVNWEFSTDNGSTWSVIPGATTSTLNFLNFSDTTLVRANVQSGACAMDSSSYAIFTAYPKPVASFLSDTNCLNLPLSFVNTSTIPNGSIVINTWDFGDGSSAVLGSPNHLYSATGTYNVTLVAMSNFNCLDTITLTAMVNPLPDVTITTSNGILFCAEDTTTLFAVFNGNYDYDWSTGDSTFTTLIDSSQLVTLTITDTTTGCVNSTTVNVIELPSPTAYAGLDTTINLGENYQFFGTGGGTYLWSPGITLSDSTSSSPTASPLVTTTYYMTVTNSSGCTDTDTVTITVEDVINLVITNLITPNGDGFNDTWYIQNIELFPDNRIEIFNRNGQVIFTQDAYDNTWGGTFNGTVVPDGTYYYVVSFESSESVLKGSVNVLKN